MYRYTYIVRSVTSVYDFIMYMYAQYAVPSFLPTFFRVGTNPVLEYPAPVNATPL